MSYREILFEVVTERLHKSQVQMNSYVRGVVP